MWAFPDRDRRLKQSFPALGDRPWALGPLRTCKHKPAAGKRFGGLAEARCPGNQARGGAQRNPPGGDSGLYPPPGTGARDLVAGRTCCLGGTALLLEGARGTGGGSKEPSRLCWAGHPRTHPVVGLRAFLGVLQIERWLVPGEGPRVPGIHQEGVTAGGWGSGSLASNS